MAGKDIRQVAGDRAAEAAAATEAPPGTGDQLAIRPEQTVWNAEQLAALESLGVAKNATPAELSVFLHVCRRSGLDPFRKQIYLVPKYDAKERKNRWVVITGIDGFRLIRDRAAARDGVVASYEDPVWYELSARGVREHPVIWTLGAETPPFGCKWVTLKTHPETGQVLGRYPKIVRFDAYVDTYEAGDRKGQRRLRWANDPDGMIAKCAEAGSLREAFPEDLGGLYIEEEFGDQQARGPGRRMPPTVQATRRRWWRASCVSRPTRWMATWRSSARRRWARSTPSSRTTAWAGGTARTGTCGWRARRTSAAPMSTRRCCGSRAWISLTRSRRLRWPTGSSGS